MFPGEQKGFVASPHRPPRDDIGAPHEEATGDLVRLATRQQRDAFGEDLQALVLGVHRLGQWDGVGTMGWESPEMVFHLKHGDARWHQRIPIPSHVDHGQIWKQYALLTPRVLRFTRPP